VRSSGSRFGAGLDGAVARYRHKQARRADGKAFDAGELLARLLMHLPGCPAFGIVFNDSARARRSFSVLPIKL